ncbi:MAG TPA: S8 family serine peptidase, partial [Candidatus Thermoplasmatota archaeon]|nr:S8 family serine peptidase [Candidatus Thermoplasmatota archaeon]
MRARGLVVLAVVLASATPAAVSVGDEPSTTFTVAFAGAVPVGPGDAFHGGVVERVSAPLGFAAVLTPDPGLFALRARADPAVRWIEPVGEVHVEGHRNGTLADRQYALDQIRAPVANTTFVVGLASVCFVDSGFNPHEDVDVAALLKGTANFTGSQAGVVDRLGHGTFVAGVVAANASNGRGIDGLGHIPFYVAKAIADSGTGTAFDTADAIAWCADRPDERLVVSLSLGTRTAARSLQEAVAYADARGRLIVAAAGNEGCSPCVVFPAAFPEVVAVACTSRFEQRCRFSSAGPEVELAAPGAGILGLARDGKSYTSFSGTSMSTPHVAGAAALAWNASPTLT